MAGTRAVQLAEVLDVVQRDGKLIGAVGLPYARQMQRAVPKVRFVDAKDHRVVGVSAAQYVFARRQTVT